ncbi:predicted protein [Chaetomium globosum CBS 148.51]|uniref:Uncharacterized protein n=1 Tax=Chaetomium globosum (strain ATCC 6205 / CBS 148.51 / DSM 1962 / NBRC 6347 / NRRL 1970) TaxID=306901 RepID=Q2GTE5_CHAGB|nr:uncharacterized protein CHGG_08759 [Chaetomium globosum CBS 148.51]EAQ84745.1 predicted protein [Chaetomium globosum CBS 148.51]
MRKVVEDQKAGLEFLQKSNVIVDAALEEEAEQLQTAHGILDDLDGRLGQAIALWRQLPISEKEQKALPWPQFPEPNPKQESRKAPVKKIKIRARPTRAIPSLTDPAVGSEARYIQQWKEWTEARTVPFLAAIHRPKGVAWWMQDKDHYALCQPLEQAQLESSANAAQVRRTYVPPPAAPATAPKLATAPEPVSTYSHSFTQQKNLRPGNIWTDPPRYPIPKSELEPVSPKTVPRDIRVNSLGRAVAAKAVERSVAAGLQVGGTCPSSYFPQAKKQDFRAFTSDNSRRY